MKYPFAADFLEACDADIAKRKSVMTALKTDASELTKLAAEWGVELSDEDAKKLIDTYQSESAKQHEFADAWADPVALS